MEEFVDFYDEQKLKDYCSKIRNEILNGLEDLRKENDDFYRRLISEESRLWSNLLNNFRGSNKFYSKEKVKRLEKLLVVYNLLDSLSFNMLCARNEINHIKSLVNGD